MTPCLTDGGDNLQAGVEAINILNKPSRVADRDGDGQENTRHSK